MAISLDNMDLLSRDKSLEALKLLLEHFSDEYKLKPEDIISLISGKESNEGIPVSVFANNKLSCLELIVKYLKEEQSKTFHQIAATLNRNDRTIWSTYNNSLKKQKLRLKFERTGKIIPISIFSSREFSVLESLVIYLKDMHGYTYAEIAGLLSKDYQTIYTTYRNGGMRKK